MLKEVVFCGDCKHFAVTHGSYGYCQRCAGVLPHRDKLDFCSRADSTSKACKECMHYNIDLDVCFGGNGIAKPIDINKSDCSNFLKK